MSLILLPQSASSQDEGAPPKTRRVQDTAGDLPVDLASYYSTQGGVDLDILSELTGGAAAKEEEESSGYRSKRKCVRVREEMSRLQEILDTDSDHNAGSKGGRGRGGRAKVPADPFSRRPRPRVNTRSQFTHKRRRRRKQPEEEGECALLLVIGGQVYASLFCRSFMAACQATELIRETETSLPVLDSNG